jgi:hypothetical protein
MSRIYGGTPAFAVARAGEASRKQRWEARKQITEDRGQKSELRSPDSEVRKEE